MLNNMVAMAGLEETLSGEGPFTIFAPTNEAFAKVVKELVMLIIIMVIMIMVTMALIRFLLTFLRL